MLNSGWLIIWLVDITSVDYCEKVRATIIGSILRNSSIHDVAGVMWEDRLELAVEVSKLRLELAVFLEPEQAYRVVHI